METTTATLATTTGTSNPYARAMRPGVKKLLAQTGCNPFVYGAAMERIFERVMSENNGYERFTTFVSDFALAEPFGDSAIKDTYKRASRGWLSDYKYFTELIMSLNHLCWFWHANNELELSQLYGDLYYDAVEMFDNKYGPSETDTEEEAAKKHEACSYMFRWTD